MGLLELQGVTKRRGDFLLQDISLDLPEGYIMGYVGENGAGKTTTIDLIMGFLHKDSGCIRLGGKTYEEEPAAFMGQIGYIGDENGFPSTMKVSQIERVMKEFYPGFRPDEFQAYLEKWKLPDKKMGELSKGLKLRLQFAAILSRDSRLLVLDEATSGLDPVMRADILGLMQEYISDGTRSVLFSTHIMSDLEKISDYVHFIHQGRTVFDSSTDQLLEDYVIVKGGPLELTAVMEKKMVGGTVGSLGFEALVRVEDLDGLDKRLCMEKPSIEQIVIHTIHGVRR